MIRHIAATRYATPLREGGSLPAVVEADDGGLYVAKFRGAGPGNGDGNASTTGTKALIAELIAGEIGRAIGLLIPEIVLIDFDPSLADAEPDSEIRELLQRSSGLNVGLNFLPGSIGFDSAAGFTPPPDLCAAVVWFDSFVANPDRDARSTNMLVWHRRLWLIDHGSALPVHRTWKEAAAHARKPMAAIRSHVLLPLAGSILGADDRLAPLLTAEVFSSIIESVPDVWLESQDGLPDPAAHRAAYLDYLNRRLAVHRKLAEETERVRTGA